MAFDLMEGFTKPLIVDDTESEAPPVGSDEFIGPAPKKKWDVNEALSYGITQALTQPKEDPEVTRQRIQESRKPKTWFGEVKNAVLSATDETQQTLYGGGAWLSDLIGFDAGKGYFLSKALQQDEEIAEHPGTVEDMDDVKDFDTGVRYMLNKIGKAGPQLAESAATGIIGGIAGSAAGPEGTIIGGLSGIIGRKAVKNILKSKLDDVVKEEIKDYAEGKIKDTVLSKFAKETINREVKNITGKFGAQTAIAVNSIAMQAGSIYTDLAKDPNISEEDRKVSSTIGGIISAIPDTIVGGWIASKFFPGVKKVSETQMKEATSFLQKYAKTYGKELLKLAPTEFGQEYIQTVVEEASKNWADPKKRDAIMNFSEEQWKGFREAGIGGLAGGGLAAGISAIPEAMSLGVHPDAKVRQNERKMDRKTDAIVPPTIVTDTDIQLGKLGDERNALEAKVGGMKDTSHPDYQAAQKRLKEIDAEEDALHKQGEVEAKAAAIETPVAAAPAAQAAPAAAPVAQAAAPVAAPTPTATAAAPTVEELAPTAETVTSPEQRAVNELRGLIQERAPLPHSKAKSVTERLDESRRKIWDVIEQSDDDMSEEAVQYRAELKDAIERKGILHMITGGDVVVLPGNNLQVRIDKDDVSLTIPKFEVVKGKIKKFDSAIEEEAIHIADSIGIRDEYNANRAELEGRGYKNAEQYAKLIDKKRSSDLKNWWNSLTVREQAGFPGIAAQLSAAYSPSKGKGRQSTNTELATEIPRMMVQLARTGKLNETTQALAAAYEKAQGKGTIGDMFRDWIDALKRIHQTLAKLFDFKTAPESIVKAYHEISATLDRFGALQNEKPATLLETTLAETEQVEQAAEEVEEEAEPEAEADGEAEPEPESKPEAEAPEAEVQEEAPPEVTPEVSSAIEVERAAAAAAIPLPPSQEPRVATKPPEGPKRRMKRKPVAVTAAIKSLSAEDKAAAAKALGDKKWTKRTESTFRKGLADWMAGTRKVGGKLLQIFNKVIAAIPRAVLSAIMVISPFGNIQGTSTGRIVNDTISDGLAMQMATEIYAEPNLISPDIDIDNIPGIQFDYRPTLPEQYKAPSTQLIVTLPKTGVSSTIAAADFSAGRPSDKVAAMANWVVANKDNGEAAFIVADKDEAQTYLFSPEGKLIKKFPAIFGADIGDTMQGDSNEGGKKITPSGRFETTIAERGKEEGFDYGYTIDLRDENFNYVVSIHRLYDPVKRAKSLTTESPLDNRQSFGCVNLDDKIFKNVVLPLAQDKGMVTYILPEEQSDIAESVEEGRTARAGEGIVDDSWLGEALRERETRGWNRDWPFIEADLANPTFFEAIMDDPEISDSEKEIIRSFAPGGPNATTLSRTYGEEEGRVANIGGLSPEGDKALRTMGEDVAQQTREAILERPAKEGITKPRQGKTQNDDLNPATLEYVTKPHTEAAARAHLLMDEHGLKKVVLDLIQTNGANLGIVEDTEEDAQDRGPGAVNKALTELALAHLDHAQREMREDIRHEKSDVDQIVESFYQLEKAMRERGTRGGQYNSFTGKLMQFWNSARARATYIDPILAHADQVFGKNKGRYAVSKLQESLNKLQAEYINGEMTKPEMIAELRRIVKEVHTREWQQKYRKEMAKDEKKAKRNTKRGGQRAAEHVTLDEDGQPYIDRVIGTFIKQMSNLAKSKDTRTELRLFETVVASMALEHATEMGLRLPKEAQAKPTMEQKFSVILRNDALYAEFNRKLRDAYIEEYGGDDPSQDTLDEADELFARLSNKWTPGMIDDLMKEKMATFNKKFAEIVKQRYDEGGDGAAIRKNITDDIRKFMKSQGVVNEPLIQAIVNDIEGAFDAQLEAARKKFVISPGQMNKALKEAGSTLAKAAKEHTLVGHKYELKFADYLVKNLGFPYDVALRFANLMQSQLNKRLEGWTDKNGKYHKGEREKVIERWIASTQVGEKEKKKLAGSTEKVLEAAATGALSEENTYNALQSKFDLPPYSPEVAAEIQRMGDAIADEYNENAREVLLQQLTHYLNSQRGISTSDMLVAGMYFSMLSGFSTQFVNVAANATALMGYAAVQAARAPWKIPSIVRAIFRAATGAGAWEAREAFYTGMTLGKEGEKYFDGARPLEHEDPVFTSKYPDGWRKKIDLGMSKFLHKVIRGIKGHYVGRVLSAVDIYFYKIAQDVAFSVDTTGFAVGSPQTWENAQAEARRIIERQGRDPDTDRRARSSMQVLANRIYEKNRVENYYGKPGATDTEMFVQRRHVKAAWDEANRKALNVTFTNEPKGWLGLLAGYAEKFTAKYPAGKLIIPFTRVAANVTNAMLEWTPVGFMRYAFAKDFRIETIVDDKKVMKRDADIAIRAMLGMAGIIALQIMLADQDEDDPWFAIYADGPRDRNAKRQLMERGWKPFSIKVGNQHLSYLYTPVGMVMGMVGRLWDDYRDGKVDKPSATNVSMASMVAAMFELVTEQSFLASISDILSVSDSPDPMAQLEKMAARTSTIVIPNFVKQLDKYFFPSIQEADGFWQTWIKELPIIRTEHLRQMLNVFGEPVHRTPGSLGWIPGMDRFVTEVNKGDEVWNLIGSKRVVIPGYSEGAKINKVKMTEDQFYEYVQTAGPRVKDQIKAEINTLKSMDREDVLKRVRKISEDVKSQVRRELENKYR